MMLRVRNIVKLKNIVDVWLPLALNPRRPFTANVIAARRRRRALEHSKSCKESLLADECSSGRREDNDGVSKTPPKGFSAIYVGPERRRFVIPMAYLSTPEFRDLMDRAAEEFGFEQEGGLHIPCDENDFEDLLLRRVTLHKLMCKKKKHL